MNTSNQENLTTHNSEQLHVEHCSEVDSRFSPRLFVQFTSTAKVAASEFHSENCGWRYY